MDPQGANKMPRRFCTLMIYWLVEEVFLQGDGDELHPPMHRSAAPITPILNGHACNLTVKTMNSDDLSAHQRREKSARWKRAKLLKMKTKVKVLRWNGEDRVPGMLTPTWQRSGSEQSGGEWRGQNVYVNLKAQKRPNCLDRFNSVLGAVGSRAPSFADADSKL